MEYVKGKKEDKREIVNFISDVFQEDFYSIMPKVYGEGKNYEEYHHLIKENGKIIAVIGVYEQDFYIGNSQLKTGFIGSVSVSEKERGKGYMKLLMCKAEEEMRAHHVDIAMLGGLRNRYGFFGFEVGGVNYEFQFIEENIRHTIGWEKDDSVEVKEVMAEEEVLNEIYELYQKNIMWSRRNEDFYIKSRTWENKIFQIRIERKFRGYFIIEKGFHHILEIELTDWKDFLRVIKACMRKNKERAIKVQVQGWQVKKASVLQKFCESYSIIPNCCYKILNYQKTLKEMLELKKLYTALEDSEFILEIDKREKLSISIKKENIKIEKEIQKEADIKLTEREVISALLSPAGKLYEKRSRHNKFPNWFPIEFSICNADEF